MGTPMATQPTSISRKKITRLALPNPINTGESNHNTPAPSPTSKPLMAACLRLARSSRRITAVTSISTVPASTAPARQASLTSRVGVSTSTCSMRCSHAGCTSSNRNATTIHMPQASSHARRCGGSLLMKVVSCICALRCKAMMAPSIASHRNRMPASSSVHGSGACRA
ncbi:hypothetical protein D9M68_715880 [compost metagenome]